MVPMNRRALYRRIRGRIGAWKGEIYDSIGSKMVAIGSSLSNVTVATLEYPFHPMPRWGWGRPVHPQLAELLSRGLDDYRIAILALNRHIPDLSRIPTAPAPGQPCWENPYWTGLDAVIQYDAIATHRPQTYMEVGSGNSTLFARRAIQDHDLSTRIVSIDPSPRADVDACCDSMYRKRLEEVDISLFGLLRAGDILLIDGTHTAFMGSDGVIAFLEVLPSLQKGVVVGIHDIFLPWDYPPQWENRWYGEQYLAAVLLLAQPTEWRILLPAWYVCNETDLCDSLGGIWDLFGDPPGRKGISLWLERV